MNESDQQQIVLGLLDTEPAHVAAAQQRARAEMDDALADALVGVLTDPAVSADGRAAVAETFGPALEEGDIEGWEPGSACPLSFQCSARVLAALQSIVEDEGQADGLRRAALEAASNAPRDWMPPHIRHAWHTNDADWQETAVLAASRVEACHDVVLQGIESSDEAILVAAVRAAGWGGVAGAEHAVLELASDPDEEIVMREAAIEALGPLAPDGAKAVLNAVAAGDEPRLRRAAEVSLELLDLAEELS